MAIIRIMNIAVNFRAFIKLCLCDWLNLHKINAAALSYCINLISDDMRIKNDYFNIFILTGNLSFFYCDVFS